MAAKKAAAAVRPRRGNYACRRKTSRPWSAQVILEDEIWSCTTCRACQDICPVFIEHIDKIIDMRRHLVLDLAQIPETGESVLKCMEARGHSCKGTTLTRTDWTAGLDIKQLSEDKQRRIRILRRLRSITGRAQHQDCYCHRQNTQRGRCQFRYSGR